MAVSFSGVSYALFRTMMGGALSNSTIGYQMAGPSTRANEADVSFSDDRAMQVSAVWSCVRLITETVGSLPLHMYRRTDAGRERVTDGVLHDLLLGSPNALMTPLEFREAMTTQLALWGNAYAVIERRGDRIVSIKPLQAGMVTPKREAGTVTYHFQTNSGTHVFAKERILHIKGFGTDGVIGLSPLQYAAQSLGVTVAAERHAAHTYTSGGQPSGVLTVDKFLNPEQREQLRGIYENVTESDGLWVLEGGTQYQAISIPPDDLQMLETRRFQLSEIARIFRVPSYLINDSEKSTSWGTGIEQQNLGFLTYTIRPYLCRWESALCHALLSREERRELFFEHQVEGLLRADSAGRAQFLSTMVQNGLMTRNEGRAKENLAPVEGGDELTVQVNLTPVDQLPGAVNVGTQTPGG